LGVGSWLALVLLLGASPAWAQAPVVYRASFPAPEHHYAEIEVTFTDVPAGALEARMSRSSPGRYAIHEFAKNVFEVKAFDGKGKELTPPVPDPYQWTWPATTGPCASSTRSSAGRWTGRTWRSTSRTRT
jgi:predicted metalloprotease with PDZ domain